MTCTLILMRHAKSAWGDPTLGDFDRPLNARGRASAPAIAEWLMGNGHAPQKARVSSAQRTLETWERMAHVFPETVRMEGVPDLYLAAAGTIFKILKSHGSETTMLICHNPGIAEFAARIVAHPPDDARFHQYPTAATTVVEFDIPDWNELTWSSGKVIDFTVPRDLLD